MYGKHYLVEREAAAIAELVRDLAKQAYQLIEAAEPEVRDRAISLLGGNVVRADQLEAIRRQSDLLQSSFAAQSSAGNVGFPYRPLEGTQSVLASLIGGRLAG